MSFRDCIDRAAADGDITPEQAARARAIFDGEHEQLSIELGDEAGAAEAGARTFARLEAETLQAKRQIRLQQKATRRIHAQVMNVSDRASAASDLIEHHGSRTWASVTQRAKAVRGRAHSRMGRLILKFERDNLGRTRDKADAL
jgi:ABC-type Fe2+-enterobactin transport system substrate-binding protein